MELTLKVWRQDDGNGANGHFETYRVPGGPDWSVYNALQYVREKIDPSLSVYISCKLGLCAACWAVVNGKQVLTCTTPVEAEMTITPPKNFPVLRDLLLEPPAR